MAIGQAKVKEDTGRAWGEGKRVSPTTSNKWCVWTRLKRFLWSAAGGPL